MPDRKNKREVKIYTTPNSAGCLQAKRFLEQRGVPYIELNVSKDRAALDEMVHLTGRWVVPVIVWDGTVVVGLHLSLLEELIKSHKEARSDQASFLTLRSREKKMALEP